MSVNVDDLLGVQPDDDNEDLSTLDRGDTVDDEQGGEDGAEGPAADEGDGGTDGGEGGECGEGDEGGEGAGEGDGDGAGEGDGGQEDADEGGADSRAEEGTGKGKDSKNYAVRFHREKERREQLERELAATQARLKAAPIEEEDAEAEAKREEELSELYERVEAARLDGDHKEASRLQRQIDTRNQEILLEKTRKTSLEATRRALVEDAQERDNQLFDSLLGDLELLVPQLDPKNTDEYDQSAADTMLLLIDGYTKKGMTASKALVEAAKAIHKVDLMKGPTEAPAKANAAAKAPAKKGVQRSIDASRKQPPNVSTRGANAAAAPISASALTDEQFDALPESKLAQMRGDTL